MTDKFDFFEIMNNYEPDEKILEDKASKHAKDRVKFLAFQKKGENYMKIKRKPIIAAALTAIILLSGTAGVNAATDGAVKDAVIDGVSNILHITIVNKEGKVREDDVKLTEHNDGSIEIKVPAVHSGESLKVVNDKLNLNFSIYSATNGIRNIEFNFDKESTVRINEEASMDSLNITIQDQDTSEEK